MLLYTRYCFTAVVLAWYHGFRSCDEKAQSGESERTAVYYSYEYVLRSSRVYIMHFGMISRNTLLFFFFFCALFLFRMQMQIPAGHVMFIVYRAGSRCSPSPSLLCGAVGAYLNLRAGCHFDT